MAKTSPTVLAIDPGNTLSAWVLFDGERVVRCGKEENQDVLAMLHENAGGVYLAIEMVESFGMAVGREVFETVFWTGRFCEAWTGPWHRIYRKEVKMHLCHNMRAKDGNIRQALIDKLGPPGIKKAPGPTYGISGDCWSALAVAVTWLETKAPQEAITLEDLER